MVTIRRGATAKITCHIPQDVDMTEIDNVWLYIAQSVNKKLDREVIIDRSYAEQEIDKDDEQKTISVKLTQEETLALTYGNAFLQIRVHFMNGDSFPSQAEQIQVLECYKNEVMTSEN